MIEVQISDRQTVLSVPEERIRSAVLQTLKTEQVAIAEVSVAILDDAQIRPINRKFLGHDFPTDTISFRLDDGSKNEPLVGEVLVSAETAITAARTANWPAINEVLLYVIHATLHLTGHDDREAEPRRMMRRRESEILSSLGIEMPNQPIDGGTVVDEAGRSSAS